MEMQNQFLIRAPIDRIWDVMLKPEVLQAAIPGAQEIVQLDDDTYDCTVKQKVGPISVTFKFTEKIVEREAPRHVKAVGKGADIGKAGSFTQDLIVDLKETGDGDVEVAYRASVQLVGRLATFGERIMRAKAKEMDQQMAAGLKAALEATA